MSQNDVKYEISLLWLRSPWRSFVHTKRKNRIFFLNCENGLSLWAEDFFNKYSWASQIDRSIYVGENAGLSFIKNSCVKNADLEVSSAEPYSDDEPMDISDISRELINFRETVMSDDDKTSIIALNELSNALSNISNVQFVALAVFDTSSLIQSFDVVVKSLQNSVAVIIPYLVLRELDGLTKSKGSLRKRAIFANIELNKLASQFPHSLVFENSIDAQATLFINAYNGEKIKFCATVNDERILKTALSLYKQVEESGGETDNVFLISEDRNLKSKGLAHALNTASADEFIEFIPKSSTIQSKSLSVECQMETGKIHKKMDFSCIKKKDHANTLRTIVTEVQEPETNTNLKRRRSELHRDPFIFPSETEKFLFIFKLAVEVALEEINNATVHSSNLKSILSRLASLSFCFLSHGYEQVTFSAIITLAEALYSSCIWQLSIRDKIVRSVFLNEVKQSGHSSTSVEAVQSFLTYMNNLGWKNEEEKTIP